MKNQPAPKIKRINLAVPIAWAKRVEEWRRRQPDLPNTSEAIRRLVETGLGDQAPRRRSASSR